MSSIRSLSFGPVSSSMPSAQNLSLRFRSSIFENLKLGCELFQIAQNVSNFERVTFPTRFNGEMLRLIKLNAVNDLKGYVQHIFIIENVKKC